MIGLHIKQVFGAVSFYLPIKNLIIYPKFYPNIELPVWTVGKLRFIFILKCFNDWFRYE